MGLLLESALIIGEDKAKSQAAEKVQGKLVPFSLRDRLHELRGGELHLWLAYWLHSDKDGLAFPGRKHLLKETWLNADVITRLRRQLVKKGWLVPGVGQRKQNGQFSSTVFIVQIPPPRSDEVSERPKRLHHGEFPHRSDKVPTHRSDEVSEHRSDKVSELSTTSKQYTEVLQKPAPTGARSPSVAQLRAAPCGSLGNEQKQKISVEGGNGMDVFSQKLLRITEAHDEKIAQFIPNIHERDAQYSAFHNTLCSTLKEPVADPVTAMSEWMETAPRFFEGLVGGRGEQ